MQKIVMEGLSSVTITVAQVAHRCKESWDIGERGHGPLMAHCMYQALRECAWFIREEPSLPLKDAFDTIVGALRCMSQQWRVCGK